MKEIQSRHYDVKFDQGRHPRGEIGLVLLATEQAVADDMYRLCPAGVGIHFARVNNPHDITDETLKAIAPDLNQAGNH